MSGSEAPQRPLPELDERNRPFWTAGRDGELRMQRCGSCERLVHPPALVCPHDGGEDLAFVALSGRGKVETWTRNEKAWFPGFDAPYVVALVTLDEDPGTRVLTNLVGFGDAGPRSGAAVEVLFEHVEDPDGDDDVWVPLFRPAEVLAT